MIGDAIEIYDSMEDDNFENTEKDDIIFEIASKIHKLNA